jgi:hypothetical protein
MDNSMNALEEIKNATLELLDPCPKWASEMISRIMLLEIETGTIKNPAEDPTREKWTTAQLDELSKMASRMDQQGYQDLAKEVEVLFARVVRGLIEEGHSPDDIAAFVNRRIPTGCRLPYCNADEVRDALTH